MLQPLVGLWLAAVLSALLFGLVFTAIVLLTRSLWPAIVLHAVVDAMGGVLTLLHYTLRQ